MNLSWAQSYKDDFEEKRAIPGLFFVFSIECQMAI